MIDTRRHGSANGEITNDRQPEPTGLPEQEPITPGFALGQAAVCAGGMCPRSVPSICGRAIRRSQTGIFNVTTQCRFVSSSAARDASTSPATCQEHNFRDGNIANPAFFRRIRGVSRMAGRAAGFAERFFGAARQLFCVCGAPAFAAAQKASVSLRPVASRAVSRGGGERLAIVEADPPHGPWRLIPGGSGRDVGVFRAEGAKVGSPPSGLGERTRRKGGRAFFGEGYAEG